MVICISYNGFLCKVTYFSLYIRRKLCILWYKKVFFDILAQNTAFCG